MPPSPTPHNSGLVVLRDFATGQWLRFRRPREIVVATACADVSAALERVECAVERDGLHAAGCIAYEAAPAFDPAFKVRHGRGGMPLLWFGLYGAPVTVDLPRPVQAGPSGPRWRPSIGPRAYGRAVARIRRLIRRGDTYQVNYTYRLRGRVAGDPWELFLRLVAAQDPPCGAYLDAGGWVVCSASPELFFRRDGERIESRPMKGTAARGLTCAEDAARAAALRASAKERAENVMIVDMVRNDLGRIAGSGSVRVRRLFEAERYPTLWQMTSTVEARTSASTLDVFRALFPPASITGAPKVRTMEIIADLETCLRRIYTGAIGYLAPRRRAQFSVAIRTLLADRGSGRAEYGVGGGIVWDSRPEREWQESRTKARILGEPAPEFSLFETVLWTPAGGWRLLGAHLRRLAASADYFGFAFDRAAVRRELDQFAARQRGARAWRVRLTLSRDGRVVIEASPAPRPPPAAPPVALARRPVDASDVFLYHKTTHRRVYEEARASRPGCGDVILRNRLGEVTESTIANVVAEVDGVLCTPPVRCGLLAGTERARLLARGEIVERVITVGELLRSPRVFLVNSVRGMWPVSCRGRALRRVDPAALCGGHERSRSRQ